MASKEFLDELWSQAKKQLPGWLYAALLQSARPASGGRAAHRLDEPNYFEKLALGEIKPERLKTISDDDVRAVWLRLNQWYANAKRRRQSIEDIVNAALWTKREMSKRGFQIKPSDLVDEIGVLEKTEKERRDSVRGVKGPMPQLIGGLLQNAPDEVLLIRDWVSIAGSAAVAEKPKDIDVVIRSEYDAKSGKYTLDGAALWVALRRFLAPNKSRGPQLQLIDAPQGSFTDYVPVFDLVARKREPHVVKVESSPPAYEGRERVIKRVEIQAFEPGRFFIQPKPTRPAQAEERMSLDGLEKLYEMHIDWLPALVQKKYDGANHQIHKIGSQVIIYSEDGDDNTDRLPQLVAEIKSLPVERAVFPAELELWNGKQHLPREAVAGYLASRDEPDDSNVIANIYDVLFWDKNVHAEPLSERLKYLEKIGRGTMQAPNLKKRINVSPGEIAKTPEELRELADKIRALPGSEGIVAKRLDSPYRLEATSQDDWIKYHNNTLIRGIVIKGSRTKGGVWTYEYGIKPGREKARLTDGLVYVGESFATSRKFRSGDPILIEAETVNKMIGPFGIELSAWVPRVLGEYDGEPHTVDALISRAREELVLQTKRVDEKGEVLEYLPANIEKAALAPEVPTIGPDNARLAFIGASAGKMEAARREPFTGPAGETFKELYLKPLGVERSQVLITNVVPLFLQNDDGAQREPIVEEIQEWQDWITKEIERKRPQIIIALGRTAESALNGKADFVLPHPSAVRRFGDSGEVGRKLKRIKERLVEKRLPKPFLKAQVEGGTRSIASFEGWEKDWHEMLPTSGKGRFVYQHHWRGLDEGETKLSDAELMKTDHSIHGDIRLEGNDGLWGWAVLLGRAKDNKDRQGDKLIDWKKGDNIELAPKLKQPKEWLEVGVDEPLITSPGEVGATAEKFSKFFALDKGGYQLGSARQHMVEIFLDGGKLKGKYLFMFAPVAGRRRWLIDKPEDQTPYADTRRLEDVLAELKQKRQKYLIWSKPGERPQKIDVGTGRVVKSLVSIAKADPIKHIVYGVVLDPYGHDGAEPDAHNDWNPPSEIEKTAHDFLKGSRSIGLQHRKKANAQVVESWVEQYPGRTEYLKAMRSEDHKVFRRAFGTDKVHSGAWILGVELGPIEWKLYEDGKINAFSPGGFGVRKPISRGSMPAISFVDLEAKVEKTGN